MKLLSFFCLWVGSVLCLNAQHTQFDYDLSGNRILRKTIFLASLTSRSPRFSADNDTSLSRDQDGLESKDQDLSDQIYTDKLNESDVLIYPNPTRGALAVEIRNMNPETPYRLEVFNMNGATVFQQSRSSVYTPIDLSSQSKGVYVLRISAKDSFITWKIIKE